MNEEPIPSKCSLVVVGSSKNGNYLVKSTRGKNALAGQGFEKINTCSVPGKSESEWRGQFRRLRRFNFWKFSSSCDILSKKNKQILQRKNCSESKCAVESKQLDHH